MRLVPHEWPLAGQLPAKMLPLLIPTMFATFAIFVRFAIFIPFITFIIFDTFTPTREVSRVVALDGILLVRPRNPRMCHLLDPAVGSQTGTP